MRAHQLNEENIVVNTIEVDDLEVFPNLVSGEDGGTVGDLYDEATGLFTTPPPVEPPYNLAADKLLLNQEINEWRAKKNHTAFPHGAKVVACDALSRGDIDAVAGHISLFGSFPANFPGAWKAVDNSYILLPTVEAFKTMYTSMTSQGTANFNASQGFKSRLSSATTKTQMKSIRGDLA